MNINATRWFSDLPAQSYTQPTRDGQANTYDLGRYTLFFHPPWEPKPTPGPASRSQVSRGPRQGAYEVIFVNGIKCNPEKHVMQALSVSAVSGGPVKGIFNQSDGLAADLRQSLDDKLTSSLLMKLRATRKYIYGDEATKRVLSRHLRQYNAASAALFDTLTERHLGGVRIVAHSQGNIITCNAINALIALRGVEALGNLRVYALATPVTFWGEAKRIVKEYKFSNDAIAWLSLHGGFQAGHGAGWKAVGRRGSHVITGYEKSRLNRCTHSFYIYLHKLWNELRVEFP
ncbi:hypothetical protein ACFL6M_04305 [Candidatus Eisenbacteria bacterium]|uniref:Alpha/beta hydrolase n=1 Tax=Eiseniibacteriota bacterium TaxID=2212470 RepID=A0ABV6YKE2_UNCEI